MGQPWLWAPLDIQVLVVGDGGGDLYVEAAGGAQGRGTEAEGTDPRIFLALNSEQQRSREMQEPLRYKSSEQFSSLIQDDKSPTPPARVTTLSVERLNVICWWEGEMSKRTNKRAMFEMFILTLSRRGAD